jgi:hypothetical protein
LQIFSTFFDGQKMALFGRFIDIFRYRFYHQNEINTINRNKNKNFSKKFKK